MQFAIAAQEIVRDIIEKLLYIVLDYKDELQKAETALQLQHNYELLDGQVTIIGSKDFVVQKYMDYILIEHDGVRKSAFPSIMDCCVDTQQYITQ